MSIASISSNIKQRQKIAHPSPPYGNRFSDNDTRDFMDKEGKHKRPNTAYGSSEAQIGNLDNQQNESYLQAMLQVYSEATLSSL